MPDFPKLPILNNPPPQREAQPSPSPRFPELPILEPDPPRMTLREKYGALYYLGIAGLIVSIYLVGSFLVGLYQARHLLAATYVLSNPQAPEPARVEAAWQVAHDPGANDVLRMTLAMNKELPALPRAIIAEGLTPESIRADPKAYAQMVARSEGWPDWLRLLVARPMAYAVGEGYRIAWEPIDEIRTRHPDPALGLWMTYTRAVMGSGDPPNARALHEAALRPGPNRDLAVLLDDAVRLEGSARAAQLDAATAWLHAHHPTLAQLWSGWRVQDGKLVWVGPAPAPPTPSAAATPVSDPPPTTGGGGTAPPRP